MVWIAHRSQPYDSNGVPFDTLALAARTFGNQMKSAIQPRPRDEPPALGCGSLVTNLSGCLYALWR